MPRDGKASITVDTETRNMLQRNKPDGVTWDRFLSRLLYETDEEAKNVLPSLVPQTCPNCGSDLQKCQLRLDGCGIAFCPHCEHRIAKGSPISLPAFMEIEHIDGGGLQTCDVDAEEIVSDIDDRRGENETT